MTQEEILYSDSSQRQHHEIFRHESDMNYHVTKEEYNLFTMLKPKIFIDGNHWCVLLGDNIQEGISGFGDTPYLAILEFNKAFNTPVENIKKESK